MRAAWALLSSTQQVLPKINLTQQFLMKIVADACSGHQLKAMQRYYRWKFPLDGQTCNLGQICICHNENRRHTKVLPVRMGHCLLSACSNSIKTDNIKLKLREWWHKYLQMIPFSPITTNKLTFSHIFQLIEGKMRIHKNTAQTSHWFKND